MRRVFYSFHYKDDNWRVAQVRNIRNIEGNKPASDNDWEKIKGNEQKIQDWINQQLCGRTCTIVLVGENTANRHWINYEISQSWNQGKGIVGIYIHGLKDHFGFCSRKGKNPFDNIRLGEIPLSKIVKCYDPQGDSHSIYNWIQNNLEKIIEEAINIRNRY